MQFMFGKTSLASSIIAIFINVIIVAVVVVVNIRALLCYVQKIAASLTLDVGEDRILLETRSNIYRLDIYLPFLLLQDDCTAQFNRRTKVTVYGNQLAVVDCYFLY